MYVYAHAGLQPRVRRGDPGDHPAELAGRPRGLAATAATLLFIIIVVKIVIVVMIVVIVVKIIIA